jgi:hypothetical protein
MRASCKDAAGTAQETASLTVTINHSWLYIKRNWVTPYHWTCIVKWFTMGKYFRITRSWPCRPVRLVAFLPGRFFFEGNGRDTRGIVSDFVWALNEATEVKMAWVFGWEHLSNMQSMIYIKPKSWKIDIFWWYFLKFRIFLVHSWK